MLFNSYIFVLAFLPLSVIGYFAFNHFGLKKLSLVFLLGMSLWFYGSNNPKYLALISISVVVNYGFYLLSLHMQGDDMAKKRKIAMIIAVVFNIGVLFYYKYFNFFVDTVNQVLQTQWTVKRILLPLGISFFTFQQVSFVIDAFHGEVDKYNFIEYACFVTFFPQLVAGPIVTHDELVPQLIDDGNKKPNAENISKGVYIFAVGLAKKVILADNLSRVVNTGFAILSSNGAIMDSTNTLIMILSYIFQLYFDFSGYSDMAIGIGKMFNIDIPQNFNSPLKSRNFTEFWKRWHITLTRFFTKYVYYPLGGSRKGEVRTYLNIMIIYTLSGLWHGAGWTYIVWGAFQGALCAVDRAGKKFLHKLPYAVSWLLFFVFFLMTVVFFRAESLPQAFLILQKIFSFNFGPVNMQMALSMDFSEIKTVLGLIPALSALITQTPALILTLLALCFFMVLVPKNSYETMVSMKPTVGRMLICVILLVWCIFCFGSVSEFLYFNF